jgi:predicted membrane channel-forming protein YqfA (hemolysin III family)
LEEASCGVLVVVVVVVVGPIIELLSNYYSTTHYKIKQGVCYTVALPFYIKKYLNAKEKTYGNSHILPCKNIIFPKIL